MMRFAGPSRRQPGLGAVLSVLLAVCAGCTPEARLDRIAERYVEQAMHLDRLRPGEVDLWFGPPRLDTRDEPADSTLADIAVTVDQLEEALSDDVTERGRRLRARVRELRAVVGFLAGDSALSFAEQARALYAVPWINQDDLGLDEAREHLDALLSGRGSLRSRVGGLRRRLIVPAEKREALFERALRECRRRTLAQWDLPASESLELVFTRDVPAAQHLYDGDAHSRLLINPLAIATVDQALEVACHEAYPGHHAQLVLFEAAGGESGLPLEDKLALLRSPASAFREGAAMAAVDLVFPADERIAFERDVLFPLTGLDPELAQTYGAVRPDLKRLALAVPDIIRAHEDDQASDTEAINHLQGEALVASPRALFAFAHDVGAYLAGYTFTDAAIKARLASAAPNEAWKQLRSWLEQPGRWLRADASPVAVTPP